MNAEVGNGTQRATATAGNVDSAALAFPVNVTAGNVLIVAGVSWSVPKDLSIGVSDTRGTSYVVLIASSGVTNGSGVATTYLAYGRALTSGPCTVTVDPDSTANYINFAIDEFSGLAAAPLDVNGGESTGTGSTASDVFTTLTAGDLMIGAAATNAGGSPSNWVAGTGYQLFGFDNAHSTQSYAVEFQIAGAAGSKTVDFSIGQSLNWSMIAAAFKPAVAPPSPSVPIFLYA
jgi:hypothetical protein